MGTLLEGQCKFMIISRTVFLTMRNIPDKLCSEI